MRKKLPKWFTSSLEKNGCKKKKPWKPTNLFGSCSTMTHDLRLAPLKLSTATAIVHRGLLGHHRDLSRWLEEKMHLSHIAFKVEFLISHRFRFSYYSWDDTPHLCSLATKEKSLRLQKPGIPSPKIECFFVTTHHHLCHFPWLRLDFGCFISQTHFQKVKLPTSSSC